MTENNIMELDLELEADIEADLLQYKDTNDTNEPTLPVSSGLVGDEPYDRFEALARPTALFLHGVDDLSTAQITAYVDSPLLDKIEWINDSACNLAFGSADAATQVAATLLKDPSGGLLDHRTLVPAKPYKQDENTIVDLFIRVATDEDIKERGSRARSRYYQVHGVDGQQFSKERQSARKEFADRMKKNGGDGRDVFSRLGQRRRRSRSPSERQQSKSPVRRRRSRSPTTIRDIPDRLKSRLGVRVKNEEEV